MHAQCVLSHAAIVHPVYWGGTDGVTWLLQEFSCISMT